MSENNFDPIKEFINLRDSVTRSVGQGIKSIAGVTPEFPYMDVFEDQENVIVSTAPLQRIIKDSIEVSFEGTVLTLRGETTPDTSIEDSAYILRERIFGEFTRSIPIPRAIDTDAARARLKDNVLTITIPKTKSPREGIVKITEAE